jgi:hypothetical protein
MVTVKKNGQLTLSLRKYTGEAGKREKWTVMVNWL